MYVHPARLEDGARKQEIIADRLGDRRAYMSVGQQSAFSSVHSCIAIEDPYMGVLRGPNIPKHLLDEPDGG